MRISKIVGDVRTGYLVDLIATLPVVISDTEAIYLYGLDIIAQQQAERLYYVHDGLGSVRQLTAASGEIAETYAYDPFGVPVEGDTVYNPFRFTGEAWDAGVELLYLRARYYRPATGRLVSRDPWSGDRDRPATLNLYVYVANNPVNVTDPSGLQGPDPHGTAGLHPSGALSVPPGYPDQFVDHRDLTIWLAEELRLNGYEAMFSMRPFLYIPYPSCRSLWVALWLRRVADDHTWDFKDQIPLRLDGTTSIMLRHSGDVYEWYEYSVPGNINFGYAGRAAGWPGWLLHVGATLAEVTDPAHAQRGEATCAIPGAPDRLCPKVYLNPEWNKTLYDDPKDWSSVEFGIQLYEQHPIGLTLDQFRAFLSSHAGMLQDSIRTEPPKAGEYRSQDWPYRRGYFSGPRSDPWPTAWPFY